MGIDAEPVHDALTGECGAAVEPAVIVQDVALPWFEGESCCVSLDRFIEDRQPGFEFG